MDEIFCTHKAHEPIVGAQHPAVQRLQFFLSESRWDHEAINTRRLELLLAEPATAPHPGGLLVIDDSSEACRETLTLASPLTMRQAIVRL